MAYTFQMHYLFLTETNEFNKRSEILIHKHIVSVQRIDKRMTILTQLYSCVYAHSYTQNL